jgi:GNAT superfamily N-acetyltransferase
MTDVEPREGYVPGVVGRLAELHATYYGERWTLGPRFEADIAAGLAGFLGAYDPSRDGIYSVVREGRVHGGLLVDGRQADGKGAQLRYFVLDPALHGRGLGRALLERAVGFCDERGYERVFLWTVDELKAALSLYREAGFRPTGEIDPHTGWETTVRYRRFERERP